MNNAEIQTENRVIEITHKTPEHDRRHAEREIAGIIKGIYENFGINEVCKFICDSPIIQLNASLTEMLDRPFSEIAKDKKLMFKLLNARNFMEAFENVIIKNFNTDCNITCDNNLPDSEHIPKAIASDISAFSIWCIWHGSPSDARTLRKKDLDLVIQSEKRSKYIAFTSVMLRAALRFKVICKKMILPACSQLIEDEKRMRMAEIQTHCDIEHQQDEQNFNTMQDALKAMRR